VARIGSTRSGRSDYYTSGDSISIRDAAEPAKPQSTLKWMRPAT
jgi:hypothetical protein